MPAQLEAMIDPHIRHEVNGILVCVPPPALSPTDGESALLHLRAVAFFLADDVKHLDDVCAISYRPDGWTRPSRDELLGKDGADELNKRLSHLTTRRLEPGDWFDMLQRIPIVVSAFEGFVDALDAVWQLQFAPILDDIAAWRSLHP